MNFTEKQNFSICLYLIPYSFFRALFLATPLGHKKALKTRDVRVALVVEVEAVAKMPEIGVPKQQKL